MTSERAVRGAACESLAALFLEAHGLEVLARNLRCKAGELDLVCRDGDVLAVVEVRQRQSDDYGGALGSVNASKQRRIIRAARYFFERRAPHGAGTLRFDPLRFDPPRLDADSLRFDVVAVQGSPQGAHRIHWIKDAFRAA
jgi:putative endonuclease